MITDLLLEGLGVVSNFPGNIDAMHAEGRFSVYVYKYFK